MAPNCGLFINKSQFIDHELKVVSLLQLLFPKIESLMKSVRWGGYVPNLLLYQIKKMLSVFFLTLFLIVKT